MTILHLADVHLDRPFVGLPPDAARRRRAELREAFRRCLAAARDAAADVVTIGGDLWEDEHVTGDTRGFVAHELGRLAPVPVLLVCGNHDLLAAGGNYRRTAWPANVHLFEERLTQVSLHGASFWGISWTGRGLDLSFLADFRVPEDGRAHLLLMHATLRSVPQFLVGEGGEAYAPFEPADLESCGFDLCLAGHVHGGFRAGRVVYPGSPEPLGWGERGRHAFARVELEEGAAPKVELVDVNARRYEERPVVCDGAASSAAVAERLEAALADPEPGRIYLRVRLTGQLAPECAIDLEALAAPHRERYAGLVIRDATAPEHDLEALARQPTVVGYFVRALDRRIAAAATEEEREVLRLALRAGLNAVHGRKDVVRVD
jgi:DNA repair protein SbcD/Mre11